MAEVESDNRPVETLDSETASGSDHGAGESEDGPPREPAAEPSEAPLLVIEPSSAIRLGLGEIWAYRELLYFLVWRDVKVRYKQTVLGFAWAILQPFATMVIFSIFFGRLAKIPSDGLPYPIFCFAALIPWTYFAAAVNEASNSLVTNRNLITKVYFPRLVVPLAACGRPLVDFVIAFGMLILMMFYFGITPTLAVLWLPAFILLAFTAALAVSLWLSALNVEYRDIRYAIPFLVQMWLFASPIAYPTSIVPEAWRPLYGLNPMVGVIEGFRWALLGTDRPHLGAILVSTLVVILLLLGGLIRFRRMEGTFADRI